jgi:hypothetical protein
LKFQWNCGWFYIIECRGYAAMFLTPCHCLLIYLLWFIIWRSIKLLIRYNKENVTLFMSIQTTWNTLLPGDALNVFNKTSTCCGHYKGITLSTSWSIKDQTVYAGSKYLSCKYRVVWSWSSKFQFKRSLLVSKSVGYKGIITSVVTQ